MATITTIIEKGLSSLKSKRIDISYNDTHTCGILQSFKSKEYFYELVMKCGRYKKKVVLFYPFSAKVEQGIVIFDYRIKKLPLYIPSELVYNLCEGEVHPFLNTIVQICELT